MSWTQSNHLELHVQTIPFSFHHYYFAIMSNNTESAAKYNKYLASIIDPMNHQAWYPDLDMTTAWLKTVTITHNLKVLADGEGLLVYTPASHADILRLYTPRNPAPGYIFTQIIPLDQPLSENYTWGRPVSAGLRVQDATISTTNFTLNGTFNSVGYQELPDLSILTFVGIMAQARSDTEKIGALPCSDGVLATLHPGSQNPFKVFETNAVRNVENVLSIPYRSYGPDPNLIINPAAVVMATLSLANGDFPFGIRGRVRVKFCMSMLTASAGVGDFVTINLRSAQNDPLTWLPAADEVHSRVLFIENQETITCEVDFELTAELTEITLERSALAVIPVGSLTDLTIENFEFYSYGFRGPGTLIGFQGLAPSVPPINGSILAIAGVQNMELVPNAELAKNITTSNSRTEKPFDLDMAELMIANGEIRFLHNYQDYRVKVQQDFATRMSSDNNVIKASGFGDFIKGVFKTMGPIVGGAVSTVNPLLGAGISALGNAFAAGTYAQPSISATGTYQTANSAGTYMLPGVPTRRRMNAATDSELLESLRGATINTSELPGSDNQELVDSVQSLLVSLSPTEDGIPMEKNLKDEAFKRGVVTSVARYLSTNKFPVLLEHPDTGQTVGGFGFVTHSPNIVFPGQTVRITGPLETTFNIYSNVIVEPDSLIQLGCAHLASGSVSGQVIIYIPPNIANLASSLAGMSLGLAALTSMLGRESFSALTGAVDPNGVIYCPAQLTEKWDLCQRNNISLICPWDDLGTQTLIDEATKTGRSQFISFPAENQYGDFTSSGFWPEVVLAANVTVVQLAAQNSRYWCLKAQRPSILGQPVPVFTMDMITRTSYAGEEPQDVQILAPVKRHEDFYLVGKRQVERSVVDPAIQFILSPGILEQLEPMVRLRSLFVNREFSYPSGVNAALKRLNPVAVMGAISAKEQYEQWQQNVAKDKTVLPNKQVLTHNDAIRLVKNAPKAKLLAILNIKELPDWYTHLDGTPGTLDEYLEDRINEKIAKGEISGIGASLAVNKKSRNVYQLASIAQPSRAKYSTQASKYKAAPPVQPPKVQLVDRPQEPPSRKSEKPPPSGASLFTSPLTAEELESRILGYGQEPEIPPGFEPEPYEVEEEEEELVETKPQQTSQDAINQAIMAQLANLSKAVADIKKPAGFSRKK